MHKIIALLLVLTMMIGNSFAYAEINPVEKKREWNAQLFIANQIKGIGLVDSYQEDQVNISYVYDNALSAIVSMVMNNFGLAKEILDTLSNEVKNNAQGQPFQRYYYSDTYGNGDGAAYCGNIAWLLQAFNIYQKMKSSKLYYAAQKKLADFLSSLQDVNDGGLRGSVSDYWKSVENNLIAYVALKNFGRLNKLGSYVNKADKIKRFLQSQAVWNGVRFNRGPWDAVAVTDVQALGALVMGTNYYGALNWADTYLRIAKPFESKMISGFDFNDDLDTVWLEGTLQMALSFYFSGNITKGDFYFNEAVKTIQNDGSVILATNRGTAGDGWILESWRAIAPTCWLIFYCLKFNPLSIY